MIPIFTIKKVGAYRIKQFGKKVRILDHGKVYTFKNLKNKKFYRIGKNRYVDVKSVGRESKAQKINTRGTINASHKYGIKLYNAKGKFTKKILTSKRKVRFDRKKFMKGEVFYRIKGTKTWVRSGNITLVKAIKHNKK